MAPDTPAILDKVKALVDSWCDRRHYGPLREILNVWPLCTGLTDEWAELGAALRSVSGRGDLSQAESDRARQLSIQIDAIVRNR